MTGNTQQNVRTTGSGPAAGEIWDLGVRDLLEAYSQKELRPTQVAEALLDRARRYNQTLLVFVHLNEDRFWQSAAEADKRLENGTARPLEGIPVGIKDLMDVEGMPTRAGSPLTSQQPAARNARAVERLVSAGAIVMGKTATHEWALGTTTQNPHVGPTRNPWDTSRIPGGSSGGNAAGLAARLFPAALGTDTGGSIRIPAALCGVFGLKPTRGTVSLDGTFPLSWTLDHAGPMTRSASDAALLLEALSADAPRGVHPDGVMPPNPVIRPDAVLHTDAVLQPDAVTPLDAVMHPDAAWMTEPKSVRLGVPAEYFWDGVEPDVVTAIRAAIETLSSLRAEVTEVSGLDWGSAVWANGIVLLTDAAAYHAERLAASREAFGDDVRRRLEQGLRISGVDVAKARRIRSQSTQRLGELFDKIDILATPTTPTTAPPISDLDGVAAAKGLTALTSAFNLTGLPAVSVPCGFDTQGLPIGLQLVGPRGSDLRVLGVAAAFQTVTDWHRRVPSAFRD